MTAQPGEWTLSTSGEPLKIDTRTLEPGVKRSHLAGQVTVSEVPLFQVLTQEQTYDDFPALVAAEGGCRAGWIEFRDETQRILSRSLAGEAWSPPLEIRAGRDLSGLQMVQTGDGPVWWIWSQQLDENWDLFARSLDNGVLGPVTRLTDDPHPDLYPRAAAGPGGEIHLVWQGFRNSQSDIFIKSLRDGSWGPERKVSHSAANDWKPALAVDSRGGVHVVWDTYERGDYDLHLRRVGPRDMGEVVPVARSRNFEGYGDVACDDRDRVWIAWNESGPNWGKDSGFWVDQSRQTFLDERTIRVAVYDGNRWSRPVEDLSQALEDHFSKLARTGLRLYRPPATEIRFRNDNELPRLIWDRQGRMWLFFRHQVTTAGDGASHRPAWEVYGVFYQGSSWSTPMVVPRSAGRLDMPLALDASPDGSLWMSWLTDHRSIHHTSPRSGTLQEDVVVGRLELAQNGEAPRLEDHQPREEPIEPVHRDEPGDLERIRSYRVEADGKTYRIVRGDMHRHTDYSQDGALDGSLHETYRYALDRRLVGFPGHYRPLPGRVRLVGNPEIAPAVSPPWQVRPAIGLRAEPGLSQRPPERGLCRQRRARPRSRTSGAFGRGQQRRRPLRLPPRVPGHRHVPYNGNPDHGDRLARPCRGRGAAGGDLPGGPDLLRTSGSAPGGGPGTTHPLIEAATWRKASSGRPGRRGTGWESRPAPITGPPTTPTPACSWSASTPKG